MMRKYLKGLMLAIVALVVFGPLMAQPQQTIKIGVVTGLEIANGRDTLRGAELAVEEINAAGGVMGRKIELVIGDIKTEGDGELARRVYQDVAAKVDAVVGFFRSEAVLGILPDIPRMKKPLLITGATSLATDRIPTDYANYKYVFRPMLNTFSLVGDSLRFAGDYLYGLVERGILPNRKVFLVGEDLTSANTYMALLGPRLGELGFEVVNAKRLAVGTRDLTPLMTELKGSGASIVFTFFSDPGLAALFTRAWAETKTKVAVFGINVLLQDDVSVRELKGAGTGYVIADFSADAPVTPKTKAYFSAFQKKYGVRPIYTAGITYDSIYILAEAIKKAGGKTDADSLVQALESFDKYDNAYIGAGGPYSFYPVAGFNPREKIKLSTTAGDLEFDNCLPAGITTLCFKNPHDVRWGFTKLQGKLTAFDGLRAVWTQIGPLGADGSFDRVLLYPGEFSDKPDDPFSLYQLPPHMRP
ncbi:MAG: ABC transporter substrate-binding protein [Candidatus Bipolaricaulota bacterium]|nr:ABC transporter substrate-binding protein [Candidatus Bipolaricaulota bacterium]